MAPFLNSLPPITNNIIQLNERVSSTRNYCITLFNLQHLEVEFKFLIQTIIFETNNPCNICRIMV